MRDAASFAPAWWLPGPHAQTIWGQVGRSRRLVDFERESVETPDGDEVLVDHVEGKSGSPRLLLMHGLEGSSYSVYIQNMAFLAKSRGWRVSVLNLRSCARDPGDTWTWIPNRRPRLYHSGDTADPDVVIRRLAAREPDAPLIGAAVSVGGNILLKWLGENPNQRYLSAVATMSVPYDLGAASRHMETALGRYYLRWFLPTLREKMLLVADRYPEVRERMDLDAAKRAVDFHPFDHVATAPLHGFDGADDYYERCSSIHFVGRIRTPTLCVSARNDPFLPARVLDELREAVSESVQVEVTQGGGHVGWVEGSHPGRVRYWAEERVLDWLGSRLGDTG
ncbi:MAG: alpha/beta fold hydrolase [Candidatus Binatia bacterium]|nr:alpha/beta fold hydrolase [Candidatus Binatia bacterium]